MRNLREEIARGIGNDFRQSLQISLKLADRLMPGWLRQLRFRGRANSPCGNCQVLIVRILDIVEDIPLRDAQMLEQMPEAIGQLGRTRVVMRWREIFDGIIKQLMRLPVLQRADQLFPQLR